MSEKMKSIPLVNGINVTAAGGGRGCFDQRKERSRNKTKKEKQMILFDCMRVDNSSFH